MEHSSVNRLRELLKEEVVMEVARETGLHFNTIFNFIHHRRLRPSLDTYFALRSYFEARGKM